METIAVSIFPKYLYTTAFFVFIANLFGNFKPVERMLDIVSYVFPVQGETVIVALFLVLLAHSLQRRKRLGWIVSIGYLSIELLGAAILLTVYPLGVEGVKEVVSFPEVLRVACAALFLIIWFIALLLHRQSFTARTAPKAVKATVFTLLAGIIITELLAMGLEYMAAKQHHQDFAFAAVMRNVFVSSDSLHPLSNVVANLGLGATFILAFLALLRTHTDTKYMNFNEEVQLRTLLEDGINTGQTDSLGYFATRRDKGLILSPNGRAAIAYRNVLGVCLCSGDPVGPRDQWPGAVQAFLSFAQKQGLAPAVLGASKEGAEAFAQAQFKARVIGDEAVLIPEQFDLRKPKLASVRNAVTRLQKKGYEVRVRRHSSMSAAEMQEFIAKADAWRQNGDDRGFSMALNRLGDPLDGDCIAVEALDADGITRGLLSFVPWGRHGLSLDVMRRDTEHAENGVTEFMVAGLVEQCETLGISEISLNFAVLREVISAGEDVGATISQRINRSIVALMSKRFQIEQLYRSNLKYDPQWKPRYLCWQATSDLAGIGMAIGIAEGQISIPFVKDGHTEQPIYAADNPDVVAFLENKTQMHPHSIYRGRRPSAVQWLLQDLPEPLQCTNELRELATVAPGTTVRVAGTIANVEQQSDEQWVFTIQDRAATTQLVAAPATVRIGRENLRWMHLDAASYEQDVQGMNRAFFTKLRRDVQESTVNVIATGVVGASNADAPQIEVHDLLRLFPGDSYEFPLPQLIPSQASLSFERSMVQHRLDIRNTMLSNGQAPYPAHVAVEQTLEDAAAAQDGTALRCAGRVTAKRNFGGVVFLQLQDWYGSMQAVLERENYRGNAVLADAAASIKDVAHQINVGDHVAVHGIKGHSRNGTPSILVEAAQLSSKALQPIPHINSPRGLSNEEAKVRQRYLDLIVNAEASQQLRARSAIIQAVRNTLLEQRFLEVETPLLQTIHGGANARPFRTHINAYNLDLYLRIAPELYLKRLMVGGVDRVFEIGRNFRNEGADATHNPEFTMLEAYASYGDYNSMMQLTRELIINAAIAANGHTRVRGKGADGTEHEVDLAQPWRTITVHQGIAEAIGRDVTPDTSKEELIAIANEFGVHVDAQGSRGSIVIELHEELSEQYAIAPTFYTDFPTDVSPLTREHRTDPRVAEKWDLICFGAEIATAYSELVDPVIQRERLVAQSLLAAGGDPEAMEVDEDFLKALEYAMPPSGGMGMGIDRLVMMLTQKNIRETIAFPLVKPN